MSEIVAKKLQELADLRRNILTDDPEQALNTILDQKHPEILIQSFNPEDLHILVKEIGMEDALPVLQAASDNQWEYILDVESWDKDRLDVRAVSAWLRFLYLADADRFVKYALNENLELVEAWLQRNIDVFIREHDEDASHLSSDYFTVDDTFYVRVRPDADQFAPESIGDMDRNQFVREFLNRLADEDYAKYQGLLLESHALMTAETEEELYRIKTGRLEEKGIPSFENAMAIYSMLPFEHLAKRQSISSNFRLNPPILPGVLAANQARPVPDLNPAKLSLPEDFEQEFATLVNSILVADQIKLNERKDMGQAVSKAMGYLRIAFEVMERNHKLSPMQAANLYSTAQLFSFGFSQALQLKWQAQGWLKQSFIVKNKLGIKFYDEEGMGVLSGLLLKRPLFFDNYLKGSMYRDFTSLQEIDATAEVVAVVMAVDALLLKSGLTVSDDLQAPESYPLTWKNLLLTLWARHELRYEDNLDALAIAALQDFWPVLFTNGQLEQNAKTKFKTWLMQLTQVDILDKNALKAIDKLFSELENNYADVTPQNLDTRLISLFRIINL